MQTNRSQVGKQASSTNGKGSRAQPVDRHKKTKKPDDSNHFLRKLVDYPGARDALDNLAAGGMGQEATTAFLHAIAFSSDDPLGRELPHPENLRAAAARIRRIADEIGAFNATVYLNPQSLLEPYPGMQKAYAHMFALLPGALSAYSGYLQFAAYLMGEVGKTKLSTSKLLVVKMLLHAKETAGREHYDDIALLLTAATEACGRSATINPIDPSALKMLLRRHRSSMARLRSLQSLPKGIRERIRIDKALNSRRSTFGERIAGLASCPSILKPAPAVPAERADTLVRSR